MNDLRTAAQRALKALEEYQSKGAPFLACDGAVDALRAALAQEQAEPVVHGQTIDDAMRETREKAQAYEAGWNAALAQQAEPLNLRDPAVQKRLATQWGYVPAAAQAEPVEPVAWYQKRGQEVFTWPHPACWGQEDKPWTPLYAAPPQRRPLTEEEIERIGMKHVTLREVIRAVERAHGIKEN